MATGIIGAVSATGLLNMLRVRDYVIRGFATGVAAHGIGTARAFQVAVQRERMPIETFTLTGRRGRFARTFELARWLASRGAAEPAASAPATNAEPEPAGPQGGDAMR